LLRREIKNDELAGELAEIEADLSLRPRESRQRIIEAITRRYTQPATSDKH